MFASRVRVIDSHTEGEPTRVLIEGAPDLGNGSMAERLEVLRTQHDSLRSGVVCEPRGSDVVVGALLQQPVDPTCAAGVIFFNDVGYLGMCGHGTIGLVRTLAHMGRIAPGVHRLETPVGVVSACLHDDGSVTVSNVPAYRFAAQVTIDVPELGPVSGDIAWGGNWFFLVGNPPFPLERTNTARLLSATISIRSALRAAGITGKDGAEIDHVELFSAPKGAANSARNFVLCPGSAFDRSPCGTGTSAKMACLFADGKLKPGESWRQEGILDTVFEGSIQQGADGELLPTIRGRAWITGESTLYFGEDDPFAAGFHF